MDNKKTQPDTETVLMALDQISQTIDVMTSVVSRLRNYVQEQGGKAVENQATGLPQAASGDRVLH